MAKATTASVKDALARWIDPPRLGVSTITSYGDVYSAEVTAQTDYAELRLLVTNVAVADGARSATTEVAEVLDRLVQAPGDAAALAAEVQRLRAKLDEIAPSGE